MIRYEDIDPEDMARYWGEGYVFLQCESGWNAYSVKRIDDGTVHMVLDANLVLAGKPPANVKLSYSEFFEQAMLHRPPLGVLVRQDGKVYGLGWQHANGNELAKAIRRTDVYVKPLTDGADEAEDDGNWVELCVATLQRVRALAMDAPEGTAVRHIVRRHDYMRPIREYRAHPLVRARDRPHDPEGQHPESIRMVLEFLNQTPARIKQALGQTKSKAVFLLGTAWISRDNKTVRLMNGEHEVGTIDPDTGDLIPVSGTSSRRLVGERVYQALA